MKYYGNQSDKEENLKIYDPYASDLPAEYRTAYWQRVHTLVLGAFRPDCDITEAAITIMQLAADLIQGYKDGNITLRDFHFCQEIFTSVYWTYHVNPDISEAELDECFDRELYGLVEGLDFGSDIAEIDGFFKEFMDYLQKKHPTVHARIKKYCEGLQKKRKEKHAEKK